MDRTFDSSNSLNETWDSHRAYSQAIPLNATYSGTDDSYSSYGSHSPLGGVHSLYDASTPVRVSPRMDRTFSPQRLSPRMNRTFSPQRGSPRMDRTFSPQRLSPRMDRTFSPQRGSPRMDRTFSPEAHIQPSGLFNVTYSPISDRSEASRYYETPSFTSGSSLQGTISDRTFSDRTYSGTDHSSSLGSSYDDEAELGFQYLNRMGSPLFDTDESFVDDVFEEGDFPMVLRSGYSPGFGPYKQLILDRGYYPAQLEAGAEHWDPQIFDSPVVPLYSDGIVWRRPSRESIGEGSYYKTPGGGYRYRNLYMSPERLGSPIMSQQLPPQVAAGTVRISPHTPAISRFSRYGYTDPHAKVFNIPPGDDLDIPSGMKKTVTIISPGKQKPLHLNVEVAPKGISQSPSGRHILCDVSVGVEEAVIKPRRTAGYFTPPATETVRRYDRKHGLFTPRSVFKKGHYAIRNIFNVSPETPSPRASPLDTTIEWEHDWLNRMYGASPSGAGLNTTFIRASPPGTQLLNRTFEIAPSGSGLNTTFTRTSPPGTQLLNRTFDLAPSVVDLNTAFSSESSPGIFDATFDTSPQAYGYQTPSYQEPQYAVWTYPIRRNVIPVSPAQDLITAIEDEGFDYYYSPPARSPRRFYPGTN